MPSILENIRRLGRGFNRWMIPNKRGLDDKLFQAINQNDEPYVAMLIMLGADVNAIDPDMGTTLAAAINSDSCQRICKKLLKAGADVNKASLGGETPLMLASFDLKVELCKIFLKAGADVSSKDSNGFTPLHHLAISVDGANFQTIETDKAAKLIDILSIARADFTLEDNQGRNPSDLANNEVIKKLLQCNPQILKNIIAIRSAAEIPGLGKSALKKLPSELTRRVSELLEPAPSTFSKAQAQQLVNRNLQVEQPEH